MMQNNQVSPRLLTPADAPAAAAVEAACFARPWSEASLRGSLESPCGLFVGLWQGERLIGYAGMHLVLGEGSFVLVASEGTLGGAPVTYYDLFRVEDGKIAEHWDVIENLADASTWQNDNGKF